MHESGENMMIDVSRIRQLIQELETKGDITLEEADEIYFSKQEINSSNKLINAAKNWYEVVAQKIEQGKRGNFIFTVDLSVYFEFMEPAQRAIKKYGNFQDLCDTIMINQKFYSLIPFKHLFAKVEMNPRVPGVGAYYEMESARIGMYYYPVKTEKGPYSISQFLKKFYSIPAFSGMHVGSSSFMFFEISAGSRGISTSVLKSVGDIKYYILAEFMRQKDIPCIVASAFYDRSSLLFVEEENSIVVKRILETPLERLVENALAKNVIDEQTAKILLSNKLVSHFPFQKFVDVSVEYLDETNEMKIRVMQDMAEELEWPEEIR